VLAAIQLLSHLMPICSSQQHWHLAWLSLSIYKYSLQCSKIVEQKLFTYNTFSQHSLLEVS
jgi:hypothetical protein